MQNLAQSQIGKTPRRDTVPGGRNPVQNPGNVTPQQNAEQGQVVVQTAPIQALPPGIQIIPIGNPNQQPSGEWTVLIHHIDNSAPAPLRAQRHILGDPTSVHDYGALEKKLAVFIPDADRIRKDSEGMNKEQAEAAAACRVLNNCNTSKDALFALFHESVGRKDQQAAGTLRQTLRTQIKTALQNPLKLVEQGQKRILTPWSISQMFTGIRGLLDCAPFEGTKEAKQFHSDVTKLATALSKLLGNPATFNPPAHLPWKGKGFSQLLIGLKAIHRESLVPLPDLSHLFGAMRDSLSAEKLVGWDGWTIANSLDAFASLLQQLPGDFGSKGGMEVLSLLVGRMVDELSSPHNTFSPLDCLQSLTSLLQLRDAGVEFDKTWEPALRALVNRVVELGSSSTWDKQLIKDTCNVLRGIVNRGLFPADDPVLDLAVCTLIPLGALHGNVSSAYKLRDAIDYPRPAAKPAQAARVLQAQPEPEQAAEEAAQPDKLAAKPKPQPKKKPQPAKAAQAQKHAQPPVKAPPEMLADLRKVNTTELCNRLTQGGATQAIAGAGDAELIEWMARIADEPPKAKAKPKALTQLKTELQRRINAEHDLGSLLNLVETLPFLGHRGLAGELLNLVAARVAAQKASLHGERFNFLRLGALMGTLAELGLPSDVVDGFLKALAQRIKDGQLWNSDRSQAAWEVLSSGLECQGVSDLFNALEWTQEHGQLQGAKSRNAAIYQQFSPNWVSKVLRDGSECIQITIPLGASQNIVTPFMCGCLDANEPEIIIIDADDKGRSKAASGGIAWILSQLDTLTGAPDIATRVKAFGKIVNELKSMVSPQLGGTFMDPRLKGDVRLHLLAPMFQLLEAMRWRSLPQKSVGEFLALLSKRPDLVEPFCRLLAKALDAYRGRDATPIDNAKWFVEWMHQLGGTQGIEEAVELLHTSIYRAKNLLPPLEESADDEVPFIEAGAGTRAKVPPQSKAAASTADPLAPLAGTILASGQVAASVIALPSLDSDALQVHCQNYLHTHSVSVAAYVQALRELATGLLPLLYDNARRSVAVEVLLSLQPAINQVFTQFCAELVNHFNAQDLCAILAAIQPKLSQGLGTTWLTVFPRVLVVAQSWRLSQAQCNLLIGISNAALSKTDQEGVVLLIKARTIHSGFPPGADAARMLRYCNQYIGQHAGNTPMSRARVRAELIQGLLALAAGPGQQAQVAVRTLIALEESAAEQDHEEFVYLMAAQFSAAELCSLATAIEPALGQGAGQGFLQMIFEALELPQSAGIILSNAQCNLIRRVASVMLLPEHVAILMQNVDRHRR